MNIHSPKDLGILIRGERRRQTLDQKALAERIGVSRQWIIEIEKGKTGAPIGLVLRTLNALGIVLRAGSQSTVPSQASFPEASVDIDAVVVSGFKGGSSLPLRVCLCR